MLNLFVPAAVIALICLVLVPGRTVPKGTPRSLIWRRKLWELHVGWLGLALAIVTAWFVTNGMKNLFGRPRPDLLSRCEPDLANFQDYIVGGIARDHVPSSLSLDQVVSFGMLVSADICKSTDSYKLDEGFRSYPSGHSSSAAAGLIYFSFFLASKFAVTFPFVAQNNEAAAHSAFPSRLQPGPSARSSSESRDEYHPGPNATAANPLDVHHTLVTAVRRQAAAPPIYLLAIALAPFFLSIFIAGSRWFDFRHHTFDILFGYLVGVFSAVLGFYYYHLPIRQGAGWAWGPRSHDKAWWAGVGSYSYATDKKDMGRRSDEEEALGFREYDRGSSTQVAQQKEHDNVPGQGLNPDSAGPQFTASSQLSQRWAPRHDHPQLSQESGQSSPSMQNHQQETAREQSYGHAI